MTFSKFLTFFTAIALSFLGIASAVDFSARLVSATDVTASLDIVFEDNGELTSEETSSSEVVSEESPTDTQEQEPQSSTPSETVTAATPEQAVGKIISQTYTAKTSTGYDGCYVRDNTASGINVKELVKGKWGKRLEFCDAPEVLIIHTHATESYMSEDRNYYTENDQTRSCDNSKNMIKIGDIICEELEKAGIKTVHETTQFDYPAYTGSYSRAATVIKEHLKRHPTIKVVLDVHRDSISSGKDKTKPVCTIDGKKTAQVMLVMGSNTGSVTNFKNWKKNLALATSFQQTMYNAYPNFTRSMLVSSKVYNQNLTTGSMLIEVGTEANTLEEAKNAARLIGKTLSKTLKEIK